MRKVADEYSYTDESHRKNEDKSKEQFKGLLSR
jgi:hypothetical protein